VSVNTTHITHERSAGIDHRVVGAVAAVAALVSLVFANFVGAAEGDNGGVGEFATTGILTLALATIAFGRVVPSAIESGRLVRAALGLTALAVPGVLAFWSGLSQIAAPAAILLATLALQRGGSSRAGAWTAIVLSALAYAAAVTACVAG
jgi:hypothetical protein